MFDRYLTVHRAGIQMTVFLALMSMSLFVSSAGLTQLHETFLGFNPAEADKLDQLTPAMATPLKWIEVFGLFVTMGLPAFLFAYLAYPKPISYLGLSNFKKPLLFVLGGIVLVSALPVSAWLEGFSLKLPGSDAMKAMSEKYAALANLMLSGTSWTELAFNVFVIAITPAILEEVFFRGCLQQILLRWYNNKPLMPLLITAVVFSLMHFDMNGFLSRVFLGLILGGAYYFSGSLWVAVLMHLMNNGIAVVGYFLYHNHYIKTNITQTPEHIPVVWLLAGIAGVLTFGWLLIQNGQVQPAWEYNDETTPASPQNTNNTSNESE